MTLTRKVGGHETGNSIPPSIMLGLTLTLSGCGAGSSSVSRSRTNRQRLSHNKLEQCLTMEYDDQNSQIQDHL